MNEQSINEEKVLIAGKPIKLCVRANDEFHVCRSRVLKLLPGEIVVVWPVDQEARVPVSVGQRVIVETTSEQGIYQLGSNVVSMREEPVQALHISRSGSWTRSQLRLNVRIDVAIVDPDTFLLVSGKRLYTDDGSSRLAILEAMKKGQVKGEPVSSIIQDISAGGIKLATSAPLDLEAVIWIEFPLGRGQREIAALARVVWVREDQSGKRKFPHLAGCQFLDLETREQDNIAKFVFARQSELRRWGFL